MNTCKRSTPPPHRTRNRSRLAAALVLGVLAAAPQPGSAAPSPVEVEAVVRSFVEQSVAAQGRVEVEVGRLDPRLNLAACGRVEPYLPTGVRLWGRATIGLRCAEGAGWRVALPVQVRVFGPGLIALAPLAAGSVPAPQDVALDEVELTRERGQVLTDPEQLQGRALMRAVVPGQALRADMMRIVPTVSAGDTVRLRVVGNGFSITGEGRAMAPAGEGQTVRVRTDSGRVVSGVLRGREIVLRM